MMTNVGSVVSAMSTIDFSSGNCLGLPVVLSGVLMASSLLGGLLGGPILFPWLKFVRAIVWHIDGTCGLGSVFDQVGIKWLT